ncbi:MAG: hypothetical protein ACRC1I_12325 [Pseudomonas proteolytica]|uniref:hypothetical protein n=1 Tax=Pseudomonas proteolytica TaxID=219574 RepID=UPI003F3C19D5
MNIGLLDRALFDGLRAGHEPVRHLSSVTLSAAGAKKPHDILNAFTATRRNFGEHFDNSTHAAVIKLMMMTFGQSPHDMFEKVKAVGDGYEITMKDEFKVHVSAEELKLTAQASRFAGRDVTVVSDANVVLAAFIKRKQLTGNHERFDNVLLKSLEGETSQNFLRGMGLMGFAQFVPATYMAARGALGVVETHSFGSAFVMDNTQHVYSEPRKVDKSYGFMLFNDKKTPDVSSETVDEKSPPISSVPVGIRPDNIWSGFYQGVEGNCVTVSAIKAAMMRFGQNPQGIYKKISATADGYKVVMRDAYTLTVTHGELKKAQVQSGLKGSNQSLLDDANFLYAVSAKRAQLENNDGRANQSYEVAMDTLSDGEYPGAALRRLGLYAYIRESTVQELADGAIGTLADTHHSVTVVDGMFDMYGEKRSLAPSNWKGYFVRALKLV